MMNNYEGLKMSVVIFDLSDIQTDIITASRGDNVEGAPEDVWG